MRILGIDPGLNFTGWGIVDVKNSQVSFVDCGIINPSKKDTDSQRLYGIYEGLKEVVVDFSPQVVSIEETFVNKNPQGALKLGYARGVALMIPSIYGLSVFEYSPTTVKKTVAGNGHASKDQIKAMMKFIMPNMKDLKDDAIDALSIALCHSYHKHL